MTRRHVWHEGQWVDVTDWKRPPRKTPYLIRDAMAPAVHPATGETMDSKSAFRALNREHGLREVGNDALPVSASPGTISAAEVAAAYDMVEQGYRPPPNDTVAPDARIYTP